MSQFTKAALAAATALTLSGVAIADEGPYVGLVVGLHKPDNRSFFAGATELEAEFNRGGVVIGTFGYDFDNPLRLEAELGIRRAVIDEAGFAPLPESPELGTGSQEQLSGMLNALIDIETDDVPFTPYLGFGVGLVETDWDNVTGGGTATYGGSNTELSWQAIIGLAAPLTDRLNLTLDYRYLDSGGQGFSAVTAGGPAIDRYSPQSHNFILGLRYNLWEPKPKPEPVAQPAPPPPPPPPAPEPDPVIPDKFIVFFDWDKSTLTSTAAGIVSDAASYARREGAARISATGHADRSGSVSYNLGLSERRAERVKQELIRLGIPENEIAITWKGEAENLVPTSDGVREPQNRRVEIVIE